MHKGPEASPAAVFIFKNDNRVQLAWEDAEEVPHTRIEHHVGKQAFLGALRAWNDRFDDPSRNTHLLVYAHGASTGIATTERGAELVSWQELRAALHRRVAVLWLVGCSSEHALNAWSKPIDAPCRSSLLVTTASLDWRPLLPYFRREVDLENFVLFDQMRAFLRQEVPKLGSQVDYYDASGNDWTRFNEEPYVDFSKLPPPTLEELEAMWRTSDGDG